ncbi:MAG: hypothetical protein CR986_04240 [Ignavibacteriae bacterium]|nr:MAG: hypothetical protein CR986_04240 [Ignavibacteriota bacterium]
MPTRDLSKIVEEKFDELKTDWLNEVKKSEFLKEYKKFEDNEIAEKGVAVYKYLSEWLIRGATHENAESYFEEVGATRFNEKFPLTEVHYALYILKKIFWGKIDWRDKITGAFENTHTTKVINIFNDFFDLANFSVTKGYLNELINSVKDDRKITKSDLKALLTHGKHEWEELDEDEFIWRHV